MQRGRALDHHRGTPYDIEELAARDRQLVLERLGQKLADVRELANTIFKKSRVSLALVTPAGMPIDDRRLRTMAEDV